MMRTRMDFIFWKLGQKYFLRLTLNNEKTTYMKTNTRLLQEPMTVGADSNRLLAFDIYIYSENQRFGPVFLLKFYQGVAF